MDRTSVAEKYDRMQRQCQGGHGMFLIDKLCVEGGICVLDPGCGSGFLTATLAERVGAEGKVVGVDPNEEGLDVARFKYGGISNLTFFNGSGERFPTGPYDVVFSIFVLQWIEDKALVFQRVYDNLKIGGKFALQCPDGPAPSIWEILSPSVCHSLHFCSSHQYEGLATQHGFEIEQKSVETVRLDFENVDKYIEWSLATMNINNDQINPNTIIEARKKFSAKPFASFNTILYILRRTG